VNKLNSFLELIQVIRTPCNIEQANLSTTDNSFNYRDFLEKFGHEDCTMLAFYLYDTFQLKIGAIRAIDLSDPNDLDYDTIVHQFVTTPNGLVIDARGIDTIESMIAYYKEASIDDDEEWDFIVDKEFHHEGADTAPREYPIEDVNEIKQFLNLLIQHNFDEVPTNT